jgi:hypothetical protein
MTDTLPARPARATSATRPHHGHAPVDELEVPSSAGRAFTWLFVGYPLWWLLGVASVLPLAVAGVMALDLSRRRTILVPRGWSVWCLFLVWVLLGAFLLGVDAPGAVPGGLSGSRLLVFGYRVAWYVACTVALLWVYGTPSHSFSFRRISSCFAALFVVTTIGGVLGLLFASADFPSVVEALLPRSVAHNGFVQELVHPGLADVEDVLGRPESRPKAPFPFTNTWGSCLSLLLPFFLLSWWTHGKRWQRMATPVVLVTAAVPVAFSLNRGLWICLVAGALILVVAGAAHGRKQVLVRATALVVLGTVIVVASPLGGLVVDRLHNPHSNSRRHNLAVESVRSVAQGSPIVGFGTTRDVQGNFFSIAGGSTPDCPACGSPPLGTQGQIWLVVFSQGLVGLAIFAGFFAITFRRSWRSHTEIELVTTVVLVFFAIQVFVYDTLGLPLFVVITTMAAFGRAQRESGADPVRRTLEQFTDRVRAGFVPLVALMLIGAVAGVLVSRSRPVEYAAETDVLLPHSSMYLPAVAPPHSNAQNDVTVDSVATTADADRVLRAVAATPGALPVDRLRGHVAVKAAPNSRVLELTVLGDRPGPVARSVSALARQIIDTGHVDLLRRRNSALAEAPPNSYPYQAALRMDTSPGTVLRVSSPVRIPADVNKYGVAGLSIGLLLGAGLIGLRPDLLRRPRLRRVRAYHA